MSFVGTRPEVTKYVKKYTKEMRATLLLPAGITSEASIQYKDEAELLDKLNREERTIFGKVSANIKTIYKKYTSKNTTIGKCTDDDSELMYPNTNFLKFFPAEEMPETKGSAYRSGCLRAGPYFVLRKIIAEYRLDVQVQECCANGVRMTWRSEFHLSYLRQ